MAVINLTDYTKWSVQDIAYVQIFFQTPTNINRSIFGTVLHSSSTWSLKEMHSGTITNQGTKRVVGLKLEADLQIVVNDLGDITDNLDHYIRGRVTDIGLSVSTTAGDNSGFHISFDAGAARSNEVETEIKHSNGVGAQIFLKIKSMVPIGNIGSWLQNSA